MKKISYIISIVLVLALTISSIAAVRTSTGTTTNIVTSGRVGIALHDETTNGVPFPQNGVFDIVPGQQVDKIVYVENNCDEPEWVRISLENSIATTPEQENHKLDINQLQLNIDTKSWTNGDDGWYYYNKILNPGEKTAPLFTNVTFNPTMGNEYQKCTAQIVVNAQGVQAKNNGENVADVLGWPGTVTEGETINSASTIKESAPVTVVASTVLYNGTEKDDGFVYTPETTDMFQNFKGVMPGDTIAQDITIKNDLDDRAINVYMYAEPANEEDVDFLKNMALAVFHGNKLLSDGNASEQNDLTEKVLIGTVNKNSTLTLTANLNVDINMGNEFQEKTGKVVWKFYIEETNPEEVGPPTGDNSNIIFYVGIMFLSASAIVVLTIDYFGSKKRKTIAS